jgi:hypothetical protein
MPPNLLPTPTEISASVQTLGATTVDYEITWSISTGGHPGPYTVAVYYSQDAGTYISLGSYFTDGSPTSSTVHEDAAYNSTYQYRVHWHCDDCGNTSNYGYSGIISPRADTLAETVTMTDEVTYSESYVGDMITDVITMTEAIQITSSDTVADSVTMTDTVRDGTTLKTNYSHYLADDTGNVYIYDPTYGSYDGLPIQSYLKIKKTDFSDLYPQAGGKFNTTYRAKLTYADKGTHFVTFYYSTDGEATWTGVGQTIGTAAATGKASVAYFDFISTAEFFNYKIESSTTTGTFQWIGLEIEFVIGGDTFVI